MEASFRSIFSCCQYQRRNALDTLTETGEDYATAIAKLDQY